MPNLQPPHDTPPLGVAEGLGGASFNKRLDNERHRATSYKLLDMPDLAALCSAVRIVIEPHRVYVRDLLYVGGEEWERRERCKEAVGLSQGRRGNNLRSYRVLVALHGTLEKGFLKRMLHLLTSSAPYAAISRHLRTLDLSTRIFCMIVQSSCLVYEVQEEFKGFPLKLFAVLEDLSLWAALRRERKCMLDKYSEDFLEDVGSDEESQVVF